MHGLSTLNMLFIKTVDIQNVETLRLLAAQDLQGSVYPYCQQIVQYASSGRLNTVNTSTQRDIGNKVQSNIINEMH